MEPETEQPAAAAPSPGAAEDEGAANEKKHKKHKHKHHKDHKEHKCGRAQSICLQLSLM